MSAVGIISLIAVALMLINNIDRTLNSIWHNSQSRSPLSSFAIYWMILTLGPLIIGVSIGISSYIKIMFEQSEHLSLGLKLLSFVPFYLLGLFYAYLYGCTE